VQLARSIRHATVVAGLLTLMVASTAFGHECYNASASIQGNLAKAEHSQAWELAADVQELIATGSSGSLSGLPVLNACQQEAFLGSWAETGLPLVFTVGMKQAKGQDYVIAGNNPNMDSKLGGNGKGIDHFGVTEGVIGQALFAAYDAAFAASCP
jgi:hypothetical protein